MPTGWRRSPAARIQRYDGLVHGFFGWSALVEAADVAVSQICVQLSELLRTP